MKKFAASVALFAAAFAAHADGDTYQYPLPITSVLTRAEVNAATLQAMARGEIVSGERSYVAPITGTALARADVKAATRLAMARGEIVIGERSYVGESMHIRAPATRSTQLSAERRHN